MEEKNKDEISKLIRKTVKESLDKNYKEITGLDVKSKSEEKIPNEEEVKILNNTKGLKSKIFQLLNLKDDNQSFEIHFEYLKNDFVQIQWDDFDNFITNQDYSELEEILYKYFNIDYIFNGFNGYGVILFHTDFKLTLNLETDTENQLIDKDDIVYYGAEYEISDEGVFELEFGSTTKFWDSLN